MFLSSQLGDRDVEQSETFTVVVDGRSLAPMRNGEDPLSPRVQLDILQQLAKISRQEDWNVWCLFVGEELEKVEHGGDFLGVQVYYAPKPTQRVPTLLECVKVLKREGDAVLLVTDDHGLEDRALDAGSMVFRADTFKKGYEELFTVRRRPQSRLMRRRTEQMQRERLEHEDDDNIRDMIDLVE